MVRKFPELSRFSPDFFQRSPFFQAFPELYEPCNCSLKGERRTILELINNVAFA